MKEDRIISLFAEAEPTTWDDCARIGNFLITTDSMVEGNHFRLDWSSPEDLANKLIQVNFSDIASSGGQPKYCLLNLGLSEISSSQEWILPFSQEFRKLLAKYGVQLIGGDTFYSSSTFLNLTVWGELAEGDEPWLRCNAKPKDKLYITGDLGLSLLGYKILKKDISKAIPATLNKESISKHIRPESKLALIPELRKWKIHSCMDITDGLIQDAGKLSQISRTIIQIDLDSLPRIREIGEFLTINEIASSGEELELLFTTDENLPKEINGVRITKIGDIIEESNQPSVSYQFNGKNYPIQTSGFEHFS